MKRCYLWLPEPLMGILNNVFDILWTKLFHQIAERVAALQQITLKCPKEITRD